MSNPLGRQRMRWKLLLSSGVVAPGKRQVEVPRMLVSLGRKGRNL